MLIELKIAGVSSYTSDGEHLNNLKKVNYIFGTNGSGKTSISRLIAKSAQYPSCSMRWTDGRPLDCVVYNSDFTTTNFATSTAPGIFTLGVENAETRTNIATARDRISVIDGEIAALEQKRGGVDGSGGKLGELMALRSEIEEICWRYKTAHDSHFADAFDGLRNNKSRFCDRMISEYGSNQATAFALDELKARALTVFEKGVGKIAELPRVSFQDLIDLENNVILAKKVVGKEDVDIAALIKRLGISDWVKQGLAYVDESNDLCPFCQQVLPHQLVERINDYFDETYLADMAEISRVATAYDTFSNSALDRLKTIVNENHRYLETSLLQSEIARLKDRLALSVRLLNGKRKEPSAPVVIDPISQIALAITALFDDANAAIRAHNLTVENLTSEKTTLISQIWKYLIVEADTELASYAQRKNALDQGIAGLTNGINAKKQAGREVRVELTNLERSVTSVQPSVDQINGTLASFGFTNFKLATAVQDEGLYRIVRMDGADASQTLSEGEKGFITFLYFFHMIRGSTTSSGMNTDRIVVFDDPVSSLDSDVLFIVSGLIRQAVEEACEGNGQIKQVFVLTHNIYFHKEVCFDIKRDATSCRVHETFWIVRKVGNNSKLVRHLNNPVKTSYELLWGEVKSPDRSNATIQNTLRRILENYFKILGNIDFNTIVDKFEGRDKMICASLFKWVHDGSHSFNDDLYLTSDDSLVERYLRVFKDVFIKTEHAGHYIMMMGEEQAVHPHVVQPTVIGATNQR